LPKLSKAAVVDFCKTAKVVFPQDKIFNPMDYYDVFMSAREGARKGSITRNTYRRYVNDLYISGSFCGLERVRNNTHSPYMFFVDSTLSGPDTLSTLARKQSESVTYLEEFSRRLCTVLVPGKKYRDKTLYSNYRREFSARIKFGTFKKYISSAIKLNLLPRLCKKRDGKGTFYWTIKTAASQKEHSTLVEAVVAERKETQLKIIESFDLEALGVEKVAVQTCSACGKGSPASARFCMHCGAALEVVFRVVVQESVQNLKIPACPKRAKSLDGVEVFVRDYLFERLEVSVTEEEGTRVAVVSFKKEKVYG
tara:strand:+ start:257 stop:1186 length:930 start_codon:yes stop_codon:yes gene_type:complete